MFKLEGDYDVMIISDDAQPVKTFNIEALKIRQVVKLVIVSTIIIILASILAMIGIFINYRSVKDEVQLNYDEIEQLKQVNIEIEQQYEEQLVAVLEKQIELEQLVLAYEEKNKEIQLEAEEGSTYQQGGGQVEPEEEVSQYKITYIPSEGPITSRFGWRTDPFGSGTRDFHTGIDIGANNGEPIYAAASGEVVFAGYSSSYGNRIDIDHGNDIVTRYAHCSRLLVKEGEQVEKGQQIGKVGSTGNSTGPHLHFEIIEDGQVIDPAYLFEGE